MVNMATSTSPPSSPSNGLLLLVDLTTVTVVFPFEFGAGVNVNVPVASMAGGTENSVGSSVVVVND